MLFIENMDIKQNFDLIKNNIFFNEIPEEQIKQIVDSATFKTLSKNETFNPFLNKEQLCLILNGMGKLFDKIENTTYDIGLISDQDILNKHALIGSGESTLQIQALQPMELLLVDIKLIRSFEKEDHKLYSQLIKNTLKSALSTQQESFNYLTIQNEQKQQLLQAQVQAGRFIVVSILMLIGYVFLMGVLDYINKLVGNSIVATSLLIIGGLLLLRNLFVYSHVPLKEYGFHLNHWKKDSTEAILWTIPFLTLFTLAKYAAVLYYPEVVGHKVLEFGDRVQEDGIGIIMLIGFSYTLGTFIQEVICRAGIQGSLNNLLQGKNANFFSVLISTTFFAVLHYHFHPVVAILIMIPGLFWSIMYQKQRGLLGVTISHALVGLWGTLVLNGLSMDKLS